jgi:hypothetical protein
VNGSCFRGIPVPSEVGIMRCESSGLRRHDRSLTHVRPRQRFSRAARVRRCHASASAEQPLNSAARKLEFNDRIGALREWEKALKSRALSNEERKALLYNCAAVHANMGDLELAQVQPTIHHAVRFRACRTTSCLRIGRTLHKNHADILLQLSAIRVSVFCNRTVFLWLAR